MDVPRMLDEELSVMERFTTVEDMALSAGNRESFESTPNVTVESMKETFIRETVPLQIEHIGGELPVSSDTAKSLHEEKPHYCC
jgi:hypothetical protein